MEDPSGHDTFGPAGGATGGPGGNQTGTPGGNPVSGAGGGGSQPGAPGQDGVPAPRRGAFQIARVGGVPVYLTMSWLLLAAVITLLYGPYLAGTGGQTDSGSRLRGYGLGLAILFCLFLSVLLHELGHALAARRYGVGVRGITLELLGGYTELDGESPRPGPEAVIALAGPAVSALLAGAMFALVPVTTRGTIEGDLVFQFAALNALVAVFNALPGLPLDGGRAIRAAIWRVTRDPNRADIGAGWAGRVIAAGTLVAGLALYTSSHIVDVTGLLFLVLVTFTLWNGATAAIRNGSLRGRLPRVQAATLACPLYVVPSGMPLAEALRRQAEWQRTVSGALRPALGIADSAGRVVALVSPHALAAVPDPRRPWVAVDTVAKAVGPKQRIAAGTSGMDVLDAIRANPGDDLLVTLGEDVIGVLRATDVVSMLESRE